jgi:hypothetical protein
MAFNWRRACAGTAFLLLTCIASAGCSTGPPPPVGAQELSQAETFPYYKLYWVGHSFLHHPLTAVDGRASYNPVNGESDYYGSCSSGGGLLGEGACNLPLRITTLVYVPHPNRPLGEQQNVLIRGVPATIYNHGRSINLYSGHLAIELTADTAAHALLAANRLRPLNAPGAAGETLSMPTYCPRLYGPRPAQVRSVIAELRRSLPRRACPPPPAPARRRGAAHVRAGQRRPAAARRGG